MKEASLGDAAFLDAPNFKRLLDSWLETWQAFLLVWVKNVALCQYRSAKGNAYLCSRQWPLECRTPCCAPISSAGGPPIWEVVLISISVWLAQSLFCITALIVSASKQERQTHTVKMNLAFPLLGPLSFPSVLSTVTNVWLQEQAFILLLLPPLLWRIIENASFLVDKVCFAYFLLEIQCGSDFMNLISQAVQNSFSLFFLVRTNVTWEGKLWPQCCGEGGAPCRSIIRSQTGDPRKGDPREGNPREEHPVVHAGRTDESLQPGDSCPRVCIILTGVHIILLIPHHAGCSACTQLNPLITPTGYFPLKFLSFHLLPYLFFAQRKERDGWSSDGWPRKGSYFWGLTFRCSYGLSRVRPKDSTTACLCPSR